MGMIGRMDSDMDRGTWGLVLSGGGAKGAYEIGVWKAMKELSMEDWVGGLSGASIGALNALLYIGADYETSEAAWKRVDPWTVFDIDVELIDGKEGTCSREGMLAMIRENVDMSRIQTSDLPIYFSVAEPLAGGGYHCEYIPIQGKTTYAVEQLLAASTALPVIYEEVEYNGKMYRDGGLCDNFPIKPLYQDGFRKMIAVGLHAEQKEFEADYPDVEFLSVYPSRNLGGLLEGTLNFQQYYIEYAMRMGYKDAMRVFKPYLDGTLGMISEQEMKRKAELDYNEVMVEMKQVQLQADIDEHKAYIKGIMERFGLEEY